MAGSADSELVSAIKQRWRKGERPDAVEALREYPQLREAKSLALELAYEEYCLRSSAGELIDREAFCKQFSRLQASLGRRLEVHDLFDADLSLRADADLIAWPEVGDVFCDYRLREELGRGMVGRVFLAEDLTLANRQVVVKLTRAGIAEAETLSRLTHRNIVPVYSTRFEELSGLTAIAMPFRGRHTLQDLVDGAFANGSSPQYFLDAIRTLGNDYELHAGVSRLTYVDGVIAVGIRLCDALAHTHSKGILHLDLKPSNVLLANDGEPQVLDFNLSLDGESRWSLLGGTMPYMSPEQINAFVLSGPSHELDERSDLYSLAVIIYQLLTGVHPFARLDWRRPPGEVARDLLEMQTRGATHATSLSQEISQSLADLLMRAMAADIDVRPRSAEIFGAALQRELTLASRLKRQLYRYRRVSAASVACVLIAVSATTALIASRDPCTERQADRGWELMAQLEHDEALKAFDAAIAADPHNHEAYFGRGRTFQRLGKSDEAYEDFSQAHSYYADSRYSACRGFSAAALGKTDIAIARYNEAIQEGLAAPELYVCLGRAHLVMKQHVAAEECFRKALAISPQYSVAWHNLALLLQSRGPKGAMQAQACMDQAIQGDMPHPKMFVAAALFAWMDSGRAAEGVVRNYLSRGLETGLSWSDCERAPFIVLIEADEPLAKALKASPGSKQDLVLAPDPLGDRDISLRFAGIRR